MNSVVQQAVTANLLNNFVYLPLCVLEVTVEESDKHKDPIYHLCYGCIGVHSHMRLWIRCFRKAGSIKTFLVKKPSYL